MISLFIILSVASVAVGAVRYGEGRNVTAIGQLVAGGIIAALALAMINE